MRRLAVNFIPVAVPRLIASCLTSSFRVLGIEHLVAFNDRHPKLVWFFGLVWYLEGFIPHQLDLIRWVRYPIQGVLLSLKPLSLIAAWLSQRQQPVPAGTESAAPPSPHSPSPNPQSISSSLPEQSSLLTSAQS
jgi:hypothetical protein